MLALLSMLVALDAVPPKPDAPPPPSVYFSLLDADGVRKTVTVQSLEGDTLATIDLDGRRRTEQLSRVIMISRAAVQPPQLPKFAVPASDTPTQAPTGVLYTIDGQVIAGGMGPGGAEKDSLLWRSELTGTLRVPLDLLKRLDCTYPPNRMLDVPAGTTDTLFLRNGDVVNGFIDSIAENVRIESGTDNAKQTVTLPLERIEAIFLAQNLTPAKGAVVSTRGGIVVQVRSPVIRNRSVEGALTLANKNEKLVINDSDLETLVFDASRVQPLTLCNYHDVVSMNGQAWTQPIDFHQMSRSGFGSELEFPGPMRVDWDLPKGSRRVLMHAELPHSCRTWGDPELVLSLKQGTSFKEVKRVRLSGDAPEADLNVELGDAAQMRMTVEAGKAGPIQDRVVLHRALILIDAAAGDKSKATPPPPTLR